MVQDKFETGMYVVDQEFRIVNVNPHMAELYPEVKPGDICYRAIALQECQCAVCPLKNDNALFYNPIRREWIYANAAAMEYPEHGQCYTVQFQVRQRVTEAGQESLQQDNMDEHIIELSGGTLDVCAMGGYCEPGSPLSYANEQTLKLLGYDSVEDLSAGIDGLVSNSIHPDDVERVTRDLTRCAQNGGFFETSYRIHRKDHTWLWVVGRGKRVQTINGEFTLLCVLTDMTEFVQRQGELREQNEALLQKELTSQAVLDHMPGGYHRCADADGFPFIYFGASFEKITGWSREEIEGEMGNLFINMVLPEDIPLCAGIITDIEANGYSNALYRMRKKDGGYIWVSDSTTKVTIGGKNFYQGVLADVTAQIEELEKARQEAEESSLAKSTFLFNASHDIRTPMNAIQGFAHIIDQNVNAPEVVKDAVRKIIQSSKTLMTLLNDVLDLSRIEQGKDKVCQQYLNMELHATRLYEMFVSEMEQAGIRFLMENHIEHPHALGDELKLTRIAMNLLSNAKKFTPAGGTVTFAIRETDHTDQSATYCLTVKDTGIGMSKEFQARAFEQFERERTSTESGVAGSGLGLAIIKKFCDLMGGTCRIESELGKGSEITVSVPLQLADEHLPEQHSRMRDVDFSGRRVLLVEDNDLNREIARYVFESEGFTVEEAVNGLGCIEKITGSPAGHFDLILMDIQMPIMDGYTAAARIRQLSDPALSSIPIVAMTANAFEGDRRRCFDVGMNGHIGKPLESEAVLKELSRVLSL